MKFHILTLFPEMVLQGLKTSIIGRALQKGSIQLNAVNIRDYTLEKHGKVDDYPYGGGAGMLIQAQPVYDAWEAVCKGKKIRTVYVTPQGKTFHQSMAEEFAREEELIFLCGHYEGIDERVLEEIVTDYVSIGDYVLTGGELPAMVMIDTISRLVPGVLKNEMSAQTETFHKDLLEYPQYSRPVSWHGKEVPEVLLSGNHREIESWRLTCSEERTRRLRPDLYEKYEARQKLIRKLASRKREHIHMMELLSGTDAEVLYQEDGGLVLFEEKNGTCLIEALSESQQENVLGKLPKETFFLVSSGKELAEKAAEQLGMEKKPTACRLACYTRRETLPVRHKEILRLAPEDLPYVAMHCEETDEDYLSERLCAGAVYGAYYQERLIGFIGRNRDGSMGLLYVEEAFRRQNIASSLEAYLINTGLEQGRIPYAYVRTENTAALALQERLGLYLSRQEVWVVK